MRRLTGLLLLLLVVTRPAAAQDVFEQQRAAALARMRDADPIYLTFLEGKTTYRIGERIPLRVEFTPIGQAGVVYQECPAAGLQVVLDRTDVVTPSRSVPGAQQDPDMICGVIGGIYGGRTFSIGALGFDELYNVHFFPFLESETMELTTDVRFTTPGRYRFYVRSRFDVPQAYDTPPRLSNILTIDIVARDAAWETSALAKAAEDLASGDLPRRWDALAALGMLGTDGAVDVAATASGDALRIIAASAHNRRHAISRMLEQLDDVTRSIDWPFLWTLAALDATPTRGAAPRQRAIDARLRLHSIRRLRALAIAGRLEDALATEMHRASSQRDTFNRVGWQLPAAGFAAVAPQVARAIEALPATGQRRLLVDQSGWREFADPVFLPMFRRLAASRAPGGAQDVGWAMWRRLEPDAADRFARRDIASHDSRLGADGLPGLRVAPSARLDDALARSLESAATAGEMERAGSLLERFATRRVQARVAAVLAASPLAAACPAGPRLLAYLFRVAPEEAERLLDVARPAVDDSAAIYCRRGLFRAIGDRFWSPAVEEAAIRRLTHEVAAHGIDAASSLAIFGSAAAKAALLDALDVWHRRRSALPAGQASDHDAVEWANDAISEIADALEEGTSWTLSGADAERIASRFVDASGARRWANRLTTDRSSSEIRVMPPRHPGHNPELLVDAWADSLDAAVRQIGKRPRLTASALHSTWDAYLGPTVPYPEQPPSL